MFLPYKLCKDRRSLEKKNHQEIESIGGGERDRTDDLVLAKHALSQLSYTPEQSILQREKPNVDMKLVGQGGLEPPTSRLSSARSNQLSY